MKLSEINILSQKEQMQLLNDFNNTRTLYPKDESIVSLFEAQVERSPKEIAIVFDEESISYEELNCRVNQLSYHLKSKGIEKGTVVGILLNRSIDYVVSVLAILKNSGIYLPLDLNYPEERIYHIFSDSGARYLIGKEESLDTYTFNKVDIVSLDDDLTDISSNLSSNLNISNEGTDAIYAIYTSGSTGKPKGVFGSQKGLLNRLYWGWKHYNYGKDEVCCQKTSFGFGDHAAELFSPLLKGVPIVIINDFDLVSTNNLLEQIQEHGISRITLVPSLLNALLKVKFEERLKLETLKYVFSSGEALTTKLSNDFYEAFENTQLINVYGSSEVSADATYYEVPRFNLEHILFAEIIQEHEAFELLSSQFNIVNYRYIPLKYRGRKTGGSYTREFNEELNKVNQQIQEYEFFKGDTHISKATIKNTLGDTILAFRTVLSNPLAITEDLISLMNNQITIVEDLYGEKNKYFIEKDITQKELIKSHTESNKKEGNVLIGKPLDNTKVLILDQFNNIVPVNAIGEIYIVGDGVSTSYFNNEKLSKMAFIPCPYFKGELMYRTGDLGKWNIDGDISYLGRKDNQIKIRGYRIELAEIEHQLRTHSAIKEVVVGVKERNETKYLVAYIVSNIELEPSILMNYLSNKIPEYMIPTFYVQLKSIPLNANGKINRKKLPDPEIKTGENHEPPTNEIEKNLVEIWAQLLKLDKEIIGINDNFFGLGGHSLLIMELVNKINKNSNLELPSKEIFMKPTIKQQAAFISINTWVNTKDSLENCETNEVII